MYNIIYSIIYNKIDKTKKNNEIYNKIDKNKNDEKIKLMIEKEKYRFNECHGGC